MAKRVLKIVGIVALALLLVVGCYVVYVVTSYYRLDDNLPLEVETASTSVSSESLQAGVPYSVVSYNVGFGAYSADYSFFMDGGTESRARSAQAVEDNIGGAMTEVRKLDPDFVLLQEVDVDGTRSHHIDELALVKQALPQFTSVVFVQNYDSPYLAWPLLEPHGANKAGQVTMAKFPITSAVRRSLPIEQGPMSLVDLDRCYSVSRFAVEGWRELVLYNLHLSAYTSDGTIAEEQLAMLTQDMKQEYEAGNWVIAGGDFNKDLLGNSGAIFGVSGPEYTWAQPIPDRLIPAGLSLVAPFESEHAVASCRNADRPYDETDYRVTVDGFIVSDNVQVNQAIVADTGFAFSDHNPVEMQFVLM